MIFRDEIRRLLRHPTLSVNSGRNLPDCQRVRQDAYAAAPQGVIILVDSAETHYVRARVKNVGEVGAESVEVSVPPTAHRGARSGIPVALRRAGWGVDRRR